MSVAREFREFIARGNVVDMAVGIIIGGAFGKIISSMVSDVLMPPIGKLMGGVDFSSMFVNLSEQSFDSLAAAKLQQAEFQRFLALAHVSHRFHLAASFFFNYYLENNTTSQMDTGPSSGHF